MMFLRGANQNSYFHGDEEERALNMHATSVVTFIIASFLDGFAAKEVAGRWKQGSKESMPEVKKFYPPTVCPSCKKEFSVDFNQCPWCGTELKPTIVCPSCKKEISKDYHQCPWCGTQIVNGHQAR